MRSALILASLALTILAAPVPKAEDQAPARRHIIDNAAPIETFMEKRSQRAGGHGLKISRGIQEDIDVEKRLSKFPQKRSESEDIDVDVEKRLSKFPQKRSESEDDDVDVEKRLSKFPQKRSESEDDDVDVEKRLSKFPQKRSEEENDDVVVEKRLSKFPQKRSESEDGDVEMEKRLSKFPQKRSEEVKNTIRNIYDGVVGIVEALKTRGFSSANNLPARQAI